MQASIPDTSDPEARLVRISLVTQKLTWLTLPFRPHLQRSQNNFSQKGGHGKIRQRCLKAKAVQKDWEAEKAELVKNRNETMGQAEVKSVAAGHRSSLIPL